MKEYLYDNGKIEKYFNNKKGLKKTFILNYKIEDNEIIINLATGKQLVYPYSKDNEQKVIDIMEAQVSDIDEKTFKKVSKLSTVCLIGAASLLIPFAALFYLYLFMSPYFNVLGFVLSVAFTYINMIIISSIVEIKKQIKDFEKHKFFMDKKEEINNTKQYSKNIYKGLEKSNINEYEEITINTMDKIKLKELKRFIENIELENSLDMPLKKTDEEEKIKTKIRF